MKYILETMKMRLTLFYSRISHIGITGMPRNMRLPLLNLHCNFTTMGDAVDAFSNELLQYHRPKARQHRISQVFSGINNNLCHFSETFNKNKEYAEMSIEELDKEILDLLSSHKDKQICDIIQYCTDHRKLISETTIKRLLRSYSITGRPDMVMILQKHCLLVDSNLYKRNGEFLHYLAKAHCYKGNSEKGLSILTSSYNKFDRLRGFYRVIFRELIQDSVLNRSEASLVIFTKYVLEFSVKWDDNYPLVCFWHLCWSSTWFSDQMLANQLLENSKSLQNIVKDKATVFCINFLREYNDDAVIRLLQMLLKYNMKLEYVKVLEVLFNYKLRNQDIRGCTEIIRNCEALGIDLPADLQGRYIRMLINNKIPDEKPATKLASKNFKLKF